MEDYAARQRSDLPSRRIFNRAGCRLMEDYAAELVQRAERVVGEASADAVVIADAILSGLHDVAEAIREAAEEVE